MKGDSISFCAICGCHHDPNVPCGGGTEQIRRNAGIDKSQKISKEKSQKTIRDANKVIKLLLIVFVLIIVYLLYRLLRSGN